MKSFLGFLIVAAVAYLAMCVYLFVAQRSMIYYPVAESFDETAMALRVDTGSAELKVWRVGDVSDHAVLYFGGNAENVARNIRELGSKLPYQTLYLVNYRGYGGSSGVPGEEAIYSDALFLYDYLRPRFDKISIIARSLGTGVATYVAAQRPVHKLVLVSPFDSIVGVAQYHFSLFPVSLLLYERYDSLSRADRVHSKTLVIVAGSDEIIPRDNSMRLVNALGSTRLTVEVIEGATHNTLDNDFRYQQSIADFFADEDADDGG